MSIRCRKSHTYNLHFNIWSLQVFEGLLDFRRVVDVSFELQRSILEVQKGNGEISVQIVCQLRYGMQRALQEADHDVFIFVQF